MADEILYNEKISSKWTILLFAALSIIFLLLFTWRFTASGLDVLAVICLVFCALFLFYTFNYWTLIIRLTAETLMLKFGIFSWKVPLDNIGNCAVDKLPTIMKYSGAGIHFMVIRKRYRASFNFLEYPRVVIALKKKAGPVSDISFSTRQPDVLLRLIQEAIVDLTPKQPQAESASHTGG